MGELAGILTSVLAGGATGVFGLGLQMFDAANKRAHEVAMLAAQNENARMLRQMDIDNAEKLATINADSAQTLAMIAAETRATEAASADLQASYGQDKATYFQPGQGKVVSALMAFVDVFRGTIRPAATVYGLVLLTILMLWVIELYNTQKLTLTPEEAKNLSIQIIGTVLFVPSMTLTWWFGARQFAKGGK